MASNIVFDSEGKALKYQDDEGVYVVQSPTVQSSDDESPTRAVGALIWGNHDILKFVPVPGKEAKYKARHCIWGGEKGNDVLEGDEVHLISTGTNRPGWNIWTRFRNRITLNKKWTDNDKMTIVKKRDTGHDGYILTFLHSSEDSADPLYVSFKKPQPFWRLPQYSLETSGKDDWLYLTSKLEEAMGVHFVRRLDTDNRATVAPTIANVPVRDYEGNTLHYKDSVYIIKSRINKEERMKSVGVRRRREDDWMKLLSVDGQKGKYIAKHQLWDKVKGKEAEVQEGNFLHFISEGTNWPGCNIWTGHHWGAKITQRWSENDKIVIDKIEGSGDNNYILKVYCNPGFVSPRVMDCWFYVVVKDGWLRLSSYSDDALVVQFAKQLPQRSYSDDALVVKFARQLPQGMVIEGAEANPEGELKAAEIVLDWNDKPIHYKDQFYIVMAGTREKGPILAVGLSKDSLYNYPRLLSVDSAEGKYIAKQYMASLDGKKRGDKVQEGDLLCLISREINWAGWNIWTSNRWRVRLHLESTLESDGYTNNHNIRILKKSQGEYVLKMYCIQPAVDSPPVTEWFFVAANDDGSFYLTTFSDDALIVQFAPQLPES